MARIPDSAIDEIQRRLDIAEVIGRAMPLKRAGRYFKANCPFHKEKTPSFIVNPEKQIFHCFGCGVGGNVFSFLMQHDRLTFPEVVRQCAEQLGIAIEQEASALPKTNNEEYYPLMDKACRYFERTLHASAASKAHAYIISRGILEEACKAFRLGFAQEGWDHLRTAAQATGVSVQQLEKVGLLIPGKSGHYDRFRYRVMFPIIDARGRVIGFGGRSLDGQEPKYLNSPETALYSKGRHLYGLFQAKESIVAKKCAVLVEGYFDCVVLASAGIGNVISPLGTALTVEQARLLRRYADRVILAFDADAAGEQATLRGIDVLVELGFQVSVAQLPQGVDPDEYAQQHGAAAFEGLLSQSLSLFDFLLTTALQRNPGNRVEEVVKAAQFVLPVIIKVPDAILRREYIRQLADRLRLDEAAMLAELGKLSAKDSDRKARASAAESAADQAGVRVTVKGPEALLVAMVMDAPRRWLKARAHLQVSRFEDEGLRRVLAIVDELCKPRENPQPVTTAQIVSRLVSDGEEALVAMLMQLLQSVPASDAVFEDCLRRLNERALQQQAKDKYAEIRLAQESGHSTNLPQLLSEYQQLMVQVKGG